MSVTQESPRCVQNDGELLQRPPEQKPEQQSPFPAHALPEVLHEGFSGAHEPSEQTPPQHSPSLSHDWPSEVHWSPEHLKSMHANEQQSGPTEQPSSAATHVPGTREHIPEISSQ